MNKKEKFYKNLSEFNIQKVDRFEFKDVKTLDALVKEANKIQDAGVKAGAKYDEAIFDSVAREKELKLAMKKEDKAVVNQTKIENENLKRLNKAKKDFEIATKVFNDAKTKHDKAAVKEAKLFKEYEKMVSIAKSHKSEMKSEIARFQNSAKSLGVDVSSKVAKYNAAASDVDRF